MRFHWRFAQQAAVKQAWTPIRLLDHLESHREPHLILLLHCEESLLSWATSGPGSKLSPEILPPVLQQKWSQSAHCCISASGESSQAMLLYCEWLVLQMQKELTSPVSCAWQQFAGLNCSPKQPPVLILSLPQQNPCCLMRQFIRFSQKNPRRWWCSWTACQHPSI